MAGIVHRAKKAGTKEWVKGYYLKKSGSDYILPIADKNYGALPEEEYLQKRITYYIEYEVESETVSLDSGEQDLEGKKIFEGDLVQEQSLKRDSSLPTGLVRYGKFPIMNASSGTSVGFYIEWLQEHCYYREDIGYWAPKVKIIGNIFDNSRYKKNEDVITFIAGLDDTERRELYMKSNELTSKEKEILDFIKNKVTKKGFPPSIREICKGVNLKSTSSVHNYLCSLESKGYIRRYPETPRAIEVIEKKDNKLNNKLKCVPCMPSVCINWPPLDVDIKNYYYIPEAYLKGDCFLIQVREHNMAGAGILKDDYVLAQQQSEAKDGDLVVVRADHELFVRRYCEDENEGFFLTCSKKPECWSINEHTAIVGRVLSMARFY